MNCERCHDTGSLSRDLHADLDCIHCEVAVERARFNIWVQKNVPYACLVDAWRCYRHGQAMLAASVTRYSEESDYEGGTYMCPSSEGEWVQHNDLVEDQPA